MAPTRKLDDVPSGSAVANGVRAKRLKPGERRVQILQTLATMLETPKNEKITTAALAAQLEVSEAALYRHFASKAQMFEGLIEFIEQTIFGLVNQITTKEPNGVLQARAIALMLLHFAAKNPGMTRVLTCEALVGEHARLTERVNQLLERVEASLKQCLRLGWQEASRAEAAEASAAQEATALAAPALPAAVPVALPTAVPLPAGYDAALRASLVLSYIIGRWHRYVRSGFARAPDEQADAQLRLILQ
ncbi:nucleoid occlusion factor SlmA [Paraburkholderia bonniea]|uniref:nucleoid occlusion factor SlmA n=1 Tax=Paraburkholderia bonniea TaxID=2152891 RepID=UPI00129176A1|nr:nucleoid occlusion factor SlmA [Paraburkholderia bonniea]WJF90157.1 nucleoid occlusion factor SlmA [Paraburkholderia bonniea]WJF93471.1 nucleoid occlusion factor SlmA [Paraburkholderia bonniea]